MLSSCFLLGSRAQQTCLLSIDPGDPSLTPLNVFGCFGVLVG